MEAKESPDKEINELIKKVPNTIKFNAPPEKKTESKPEAMDEWVKKISEELANAYWALVRLRCFETHAESEKFKDEMHNKEFGEFVSIFKKGAELHIKVGDQILSLSVFPASYYVNPIKDFISKQGDRQIDVVQQIIMQIAAIPIVAKMARGKILYPEIEKMGKEIAELKEKNLRIINQLETMMEASAIISFNVESAICRGNELFYATRNKIEKWRQELQKEGG